MKRFFSVFIAAMMIMTTFSGCGEKESDEEYAKIDKRIEKVEKDKKNKNKNSQEKDSKEKEAEAEKILIGGIGPTTGGAGIYGQAVENAAELAVEEINAAGGINGAEIEFKFCDDEHNPEKAVDAYNELKDWGMQILMGTVTSRPCIEVSEEAEYDNMFMITPSGSADECVAPDNVFRVCFSDPYQGAASAQYIGLNNLAKKVAVIYDSSDVYSYGIAEMFRNEAYAWDFEIVCEEAFTAETRTDFTVQIQKAKDAGAELIFLPIYYQEASLILSQAKQMGFEPKFFGCDGLDGILAVEGFDTSLAEELMILTPFAVDAEDEKTRKFVKAYKDKYGELPNQFAADAYDAIYAIKLAGDKAGITADMSVSEICEALKSTMTEIELNGLTGTITWEADGEPLKEPKAVKILNGAYRAM